MKKIVALLLLLFHLLPLRADQVALSFYNDFFVGEDQHFTNAIAFIWLEDNKENSFTQLFLNAADTLSLELDSSKKYNAGVSLSQIIVTPEDTTQKNAQYNDMPYAGYLALSTYLIQSTKQSFTEAALDIGVVGDNSLAGEVQSNFHHLIGNTAPAGWDTQLDNRFTLNLYLDHGEISWRGKLSDSLDADWFNHIGATLGTFTTSAFSGTSFRFGKNYVHNFNQHFPYLKEEANIINIDKEHHGFGWSISSGCNAEALAYSYILDEAHNEGYSVTKQNFNASLFLSTDFYYNSHKLSYFLQTRTPFIKEQNILDTFGGFLYTYKF